MGEDLEIPDEMAKDEADQDKAGQRHDEFAANGRAEEVTDEIHRGRAGYDSKPHYVLPIVGGCKETEIR